MLLGFSNQLKIMENEYSSKGVRYLFSYISLNHMVIVLPVMLSSKLLPEMEKDDNTKREQLLHGMQNLPLASQIEKLKVTQNEMSIELAIFYQCVWLVLTIVFIGKD